MKGLVRKLKTGLEQRLQVIKKQPAQKLEEVHWYSIRAMGFVGAHFRYGRGNLYICD